MFIRKIRKPLLIILKFMMFNGSCLARFDKGKRDFFVLVEVLKDGSRVALGGNYPTLEQARTAKRAYRHKHIIVAEYRDGRKVSEII